MGINDGWQADVQTEYAIPIYKQFWDGCEVIENDANGETEETALILDFGDVDKIIRIACKNILLAQRFRKPYWDGEDGMWKDPDFSLRYSRPTSDNIIEYERLMRNYEDPAAFYPRRYSFGRVYNDHNHGLYELYILDTKRIIETIKAGTLPEDGPIPTNEGQEMMTYAIDDLRDAGAILKEWHDRPPGERDRPAPAAPTQRA